MIAYQNNIHTHIQWHAHTSLCLSTHTTINKILMISNNDTNLNLFFHPPNLCLLLLTRSLMLSPSPLPSPLALSIYIQLPHTDTPFFRVYRKAWANKVFSCNLNWDSVGTFLRVVGREFQRDGAMKLKECWPNDLRFCFGIFSSFSLEDWREQDGL